MTLKYRATHGKGRAEVLKVEMNICDQQKEKYKTDIPTKKIYKSDIHLHLFLSCLK